MKIFTALKCLINGKKVRHVSWDKGSYIYLDQEYVNFIIKAEDDISYVIYAEEILKSMKNNDNGWKVLKKKQPKLSEPWIKIDDCVLLTYLDVTLKVVYCDEDKAFAVCGEQYCVIFKRNKNRDWFLSK